MTSTTARMLWTGLLLALTVPLTAWLWGFSVDDAWIVSRVVENGLSSGTYAFNRGGVRTDAITPLGFAELIAAAHRLTGKEAFAAARTVGMVASGVSWALAAWCALAEPAPSSTASGPGTAADRAPPAWRRLLPWMIGLALCPTWAAWAGAGLETPVVGLFCTLGCALSERWADRDIGARLALVGAACLGAAIGWRPELVGFGAMTVLQLGRRRRARWSTSELWWLATFATFACLPALVRISWFGTPLPLAFVAKEPDARSGLRYLLGSLVFCGPLWLLWPVAWEGKERDRRWSAVALAHGACLLVAGGDWMPLYRLWVPVLPWLGAVGVRAWRPSRAGWTFVLLAGLANALLASGLGPASRRVVANRQAMVQALEPFVRDAQIIAAVDIGWVGRGTGAEIVDLAGVTDPRVATLPGGHTSKQIAPGFFAARSVDTWIIRARDRSYVPGEPLESIDASYAVDARLLGRAADLSFRGIGVVPIPSTGEQYVIARHEPEARGAER